MLVIRTKIRTTIANYSRILMVGLALYAIALPPASAEEPLTARSSGWFSRLWAGYSSIADTSGTFADVSDLALQEVDVTTSEGFVAGAGLGYRYGPQIAVELAWEYRSNNSDTRLGEELRFDDGNYASNTLFLNGYYHLGARGRWDPYIGAGISWSQEIDIDLEANGPERSFSGDGGVGGQIFFGSTYWLSERLGAHGELRYGVLRDIDLDGENVSGTITGFDYEPLTLQFGLNYRF